MESNFGHAHTHSHFSSLDGMSNVDRLVEKSSKNKQEWIGLTDHGNMAGTVQLYKAGKKYGVDVFPGVEGYLVLDDIEQTAQTGAKTSDMQRYHIGLLARNQRGYRALVGLVSATHTRPYFNRFPRMTLDMLASVSTDAGDDIILTTGCYFGLIQQHLSKGEYVKARTYVKMFHRMFPNTFVEIQRHGIDSNDEDEMCSSLLSIADSLGLPVLATQDSHYAEESQKSAHALMKRMVYGNSEDEFPGDSYHFASTEWVKYHYADKVWDRVEEASNHFHNLHELSLPALDTFKFHCPQNVSNPQQVVRKFCFSELRKRRFSTKDKYVTRLNHELDIIEHLGIAGYLTMWMQIVEWCKSKHIVIEARGSANSSLVCYLLGITQVDSVKWGLLFERFLSKDRKKPPDIDMDVEDGERSRLLAYIQKTYPTLQIGTFSKLGSSADGERGSVLVSYTSGLRRSLGNETYARKGMNSIQSISDVKRYSKRDYEALKKLGHMEVYKSYGVHAAGILIGTDTQPIEDYVPSMLVASSNTSVTQFAMKDVEQLGYLKLDVLGQRSLTAMKLTNVLLDRDDPTDFSWIPEDDPGTAKTLRSGRTNTGVFQFDGYAMAMGGRMMKARTTKDCILAGALFRPAVMENGLHELWVQRRNDTDMRRRIKYPHPVFEKHLKATYGIVLFQEQVINIMRGLGMTFEGINIFFDAVKDSGSGSGARNLKRFHEVRAEFDSLCRNNGITDVEGAWHYIEGYVSYGFNQGHATGYGIRSYRTAYLKTHYPLEYMSASLESCAMSNAKDKEIAYAREARMVGIRILPPDINISGPFWTMDTERGAIRRGLTTVKGVGASVASALEEVREEGGPYKSISDIIERTVGRRVSGGKTYAKDGLLNGALEALRDAGALDSVEG